MLHGPLLKRVGLALLGLLLITTSSLVVSGLLDVSEVLEEELVVGPEWREDHERYDEFEPMRQRAVVVSQEGDDLRLTWTLTTSPRDPVVAAVSAGETLAQPIDFTGEVAYADVSRADGDRASLYGEVGLPTTAMSGDRAHLEAGAELSLDDREAVVELFSACGECRVDVEVRAEDYQLVGLSRGDPFDEGEEVGDPVEAESRDRSSAAFSLESFEGVTIQLAPPGATVGPASEDLIELERAEAWSAAWQRFCFALPWLFLLAIPLPRSPGGVPRRTIGLALSGLLLALFVTVYAELENPLRDLVQRGFDWFYPGAPYYGGSPGAPAATLLGVVWGGVALGYLLRRRSAMAALSVYLVGVLAGGAALVGLAVAEGGSSPLYSPTGRSWVPLLIWLGVTLVGAVLVSAAVGWRLVPWPLWLLVAGAATASVAAMAGLTRLWSEPAAWIAGGATTVYDAVFLATLIAVPLAILRRRPASNPSSSPPRLVWLRRAVWPALFALCFWIALPQQYYAGALAPLGPTDAFRVAGATVPAARVALFVALLVYLWVLARHSGGSDPHGMRMLAWAAGAVMLLRPDVLLGGVPLSFLVGVLLLSWAIPKGAEHVPADKATVRQVVAAGHRSRLLGALEGTLEQKVTAGDKSFADATSEFTAARGHAQAIDGTSVTDTSREDRLRAFGSGGPDAWRRGLIGAGVAAVAGLPGFVQALAELSRAGDFEGAVPILSASSTLILVLRYPLYGFFFGYFLPWIRGDTGVAKSFTFGVVLGVSELVALLLPYQQNEAVLSALVAWGAQIFLVCFALGLAFDARTLRWAGLRVGHLLDVHQTNRAVALSSAVVASAATALATTLASSAVSLITARLGGG